MINSDRLVEEEPRTGTPTGRPTVPAFGLLADALTGAAPGALPPGVEPLSALPPGVEALPARRASNDDDAIKFLHNLGANPNEGVPVPFDPVKYRQRNPVLAQMLIERPDLAPALVADEKPLSMLEQILRPFTGTFSIGEATVARWKIGKLNVELAALAHRQREAGGSLSPEDEAKAQEIEREIQATKMPQMGLIADFIPALAAQVPRYLRAGAEMASYAEVGAITGGMAGMAGGPIGVPIGAAMGLTGGLAMGVFATTQREEGDLFYRQSIREGVPPTLAAWGAAVVGAANGLLEAAPTESILRIVPGAKAILNGPTKDIIRAAIHNPRTRSVLLRAGLRMQEGMVFEGITEGLQEIVSTYALATEKGESGIQAVIEDISKGNESQILQSGFEGYKAAGGMVIVSPGVWVESGTEMIEAKKAKSRADVFKALGETIQTSEVFKKLPAEARALVEKVQAKYGKIEDVSVPAGKLNKLLAANNVEIDSLPAGVVEQLKSAGETDEISIKMSDLAANVAVLKGFEGLTPDIRVGDSMTAREAITMEEEVKATQEAMKEEPVSDKRPAEDTSPGIHGAKEEGPVEPKNFVMRPLDRGDMTEAAYNKYLKGFAPAMQAAREAADKASAREWKRAVHDDEKVARAIFEEQVKKDKAFNARSEILTGKRLDGGKSKKSMNTPLDLDWLREHVDDALLKHLVPLARSGGMDPIRAAKYYGFKSATEMVWELANKHNESKWIKEQVNAMLAEKYPGYNGKRAWAKENEDRALHVDSVGNAIWAGAQAMNSRKATASARAVIKEAAVRDVDASPVWSMSLARAARNEARAAKEAAEAWRARDIDAAYDATQRQMYHHYVWIAINDKLDSIEKFKKFTERFDSKSLRKKIAAGGEHFLYGIDSLLYWIGRRGQPPPWSVAQIAERLGQYNENLGRMYLETLYSMPTEKATGIGDWQEMTGTQFDQLQSLLTSFRNLGEEKGTIELGQRKAVFNEEVAALVGSIEKNRPPPPPGVIYANDYGWAAVKTKMREWDWSLRKIEFLTRVLDGGETAGLAHQMIFQPFVDAEVQEYVMSKTVLKELQADFDRFNVLEKFAHDRMVEFLPTEIDGKQGMLKLRRRDVLAIALNMRNEGNMSRLLSSMGWTKEDVLARLDKILDDKDIELVNKLGGIAEKFWPQVKEVYRKKNGQEPKIVTGKDVTLPSGRVIEGGYYPIIKDYSKVTRPTEDPNELFDIGTFDPVGVNDNFTRERAKKNADPLLLDIDALPRHLVKVIHYVTHYDAVTNVDRLTQTKDVKAAIVAGVGQEAYDQIRPWLRDIGRQSSQGDGVMSTAEKFLRRIRIGASIVLLFFKTSTAVKQIIGLTTTIKEIGIGYTAIGTTRFIKDIGTWISSGFTAPNPFNAISENDPTFRLMRENIDRDIKDIYRASTSGIHMTAAFRHGVVTFGMALFNLFQGTVNAITWHGAYAKAVKEGHARPVEFASAIVRMSQSSGGIKDLAAFQRGKEWQKLFTVMYSWYSVLYNQIAETATGQSIDKTKAQQVGTAAAHAFYLVLLPSFLSVAMRGHLSDDREPEDMASEIALETALFTANAFPMADQVAKAVLEGRDARVAPWLDMLIKGAGSLHKVFTDEDLTDADVRNAWNAAGTVLNAPTGAALNAWNYLEALLDGSMEDPVEDLLFRTPREAR